MFQDIRPHEFHNQFEPRRPEADDYILIYKDNQVILLNSGAEMILPQYKQINQICPAAAGQLIYLLSVDDRAFYLSWQEAEETENAAYYGIMSFRAMQPGWLAFPGATAFHLARWYDANRYCGKCGASMQHKGVERALKCPQCGLEVYPRISPVVMVGIRDGEKLLLIKYAHSHAAYRRHALIAGFMEIGETLEDTVRREVMEEVGLQVKNIRYYKSQPWAFSETLLVGFFADLDGSSEVILDETELSEAEWIRRDDLKMEDSTLSLTWDMIEAFRLGIVK